MNWLVSRSLSGFARANPQRVLIGSSLIFELTPPNNDNASEIQLTGNNLMWKINSQSCHSSEILTLSESF